VAEALGSDSIDEDIRRLILESTKLLKGAGLLQGTSLLESAKSLSEGWLKLISRINSCVEFNGDNAPEFKVFSLKLSDEFIKKMPRCEVEFCQSRTL
jgi:hypothetical protein